MIMDRIFGGGSTKDGSNGTIDGRQGESLVQFDRPDLYRAGAGFDRVNKVERTKMVIAIKGGGRKMFDLTIAGLKALINGVAERIQDRGGRGIANDSDSGSEDANSQKSGDGSQSRHSESFSETHQSISNHRNIGYISYRDCKQIFTEGVLVPSIEMRRHSILICIPPVIAFIFHDGVYLLPNDELHGDVLLAKVGTLVEELNTREKKNKSTNKCIQYIPFEIAALEAILQCACEHLDYDVQEMEKKMKELSKKVDKKTTSSTHLMQLIHSLKNPVSAVQSRVDAFSIVLEDLFESRIDLIHMNLSRFAKNPLLYGNSEALSVNPELEMILEYFDQEIDQIKERARQIKEAVGNYEKLIELRLSLTRNKLIKLELTVTIAATVLGIGHTISAVYGMNLANGWENTPDSYFLFKIISLICYFGVVVACFTPFVIWSLVPL